MDLLIIGGTIFLGRHLVDAALARGHRVTLFNRGLHNADLYPDVEKLRGDRATDLSALEGRRWDAVIDTCGYFPRIVRESAKLLADAVEHYTFVSSISVYSDMSTPDMDESGPVGTLEDESVEEITGETYGPLKAACERAVEEEMPGRTLVVRPGLIVGPWDPTDRFTYWPLRVARGGDVLAPGSPDDPTQIIDVRDLAEWMISMAEARTVGVYNATGPDYRLTMGRVIDESKRVTGSDAVARWADPEFLEKHQVHAWSDMPAWVPVTPETAGFSTSNVSRAIAQGLTFRDLGATISDTLAWFATLPEERRSQLRAGIKPEREAEVLEELSRTENGGRRTEE